MNSFKILFTGDVFIKQMTGNILSKELSRLFQEHELRSCNFEAPLAIEGMNPIPKAGTHLFQTNEAVKCIKEAGFNILSMANNHIYDYGDKALANTLNSLKNHTVVGAGENFNDAYKLKTVQVNNIKIGFLSFCESEFGALTSDRLNRGGYAWINHPSAEGLVRESKKEVELLIVQAHAGIEEIELPLPEWRDIYKRLILNGADIIIGHHPHVPQGWEIFNGKYIFYSLGNFFFDMESNEKNWNKSFVVSVEITGKDISGITTIPIQRNGSIVGINNDSSFAAYLQKLCDKLHNETYYSEIDAIALELWQTRYKKYYLSALNGLAYEDNIYKMLKVFVRKFMSKSLNNKNNLLLLHNIRIESHRWLVERALSILSER